MLYFFASVGFVFTTVFIGMQFGVFNVRGTLKERNEFFLDGVATSTTQLATTTKSDGKEALCINKANVCSWNETREWVVVKNGLTKDVDVIQKVSKETHIPARTLASLVIPEQLRFFTAEREVFKRYFEPLKILGSMSQFSLGVSGIKPDTALKIEQYANDASSPYYPGPEYAKLIAYDAGVDVDAERYNRLTDPKNHYYSYVYAAIFVAEIEAQWKKSGFDISNNREVLATLFNLGFLKSNPHGAPAVGGATISLGGSDYLYGELGALFYNSNELLQEFPKQ